ncbi:DUF7694 domain-containing protein [Alicyclobacillus macrosporangiidus]|jgi:hypothetical protein|uniref:DUF7694 domain-containing protein n=1 Tax=Alicyclobacillus macrosporangiidus TaxID=392015 RepID=A0A1I7FTX2_9BACL|nr:hypothetical protein [Alicyclobacillus macrosporangiidus]SFU39659.1 hypothetical protein SAMN05421543_101454 [Alicyclobacillus macrosporangiidus]
MKPVYLGEVWPGCKAYRFGECTVLVERHRKIGWHMSISHPNRYPTWDEIRDARYELVPDDVTMAMLLPPRREYVNLHQNCFHLHEIKE